MIELYKDGNCMAIQTDCENEEDFLYEMSELLESMIGKGKFLFVTDMEGASVMKGASVEQLISFLEEHKKGLSCDWGFQFSNWLPQIVDICCKYRGFNKYIDHEHTVYEKKLLIAGGPILSGDSLVGSSFNHGA